MTWRVSAATIGVIRTAWAMIMACGVNRMPRLPSGPERDSSRNTTSPTTTGGRPMQPLRITISASRPGNRVRATSAPSGMPTRAASTVADSVTNSDSPTIANSFASPDQDQLQRAEVVQAWRLRARFDVVAFPVFSSDKSNSKIGCRHMQFGAGLELLTTAEAAGYLRLKERKLYELVAERQIPCTKVTGKWLFSRADLDRWLLAGMARPHGVVPAEPPPIVGGSHDPLLQWALSESRRGTGDPARGQRGRLPALPQGRGDRRCDPFSRSRRSRKGCKPRHRRAARRRSTTRS